MYLFATVSDNQSLHAKRNLSKLVFLFFFGGLGGGGEGGEEEEVGALKLFALTQYCTKLFQATFKQITILSKK